MKIEHIAIWTSDIEKLSEFYVKYFDGTRNEKYINQNKNFASYFISFDSGCRLEIMQMQGVPDSKNDAITQFTGIIHFAFDVENREALVAKTNQLEAAGFQVIDGPRVTGDGYFESVILDPDQNRVELSCLA